MVMLRIFLVHDSLIPNWTVHIQFYHSYRMSKKLVKKSWDLWSLMTLAKGFWITWTVIVVYINNFFLFFVEIHVFFFSSIAYQKTYPLCYCVGLLVYSWSTWHFWAVCQMKDDPCTFNESFLKLSHKTVILY